jgi:hypothetical protein
VSRWRSGEGLAAALVLIGWSVERRRRRAVHPSKLTAARLIGFARVASTPDRARRGGDQTARNIHARKKGIGSQVRTIARD